MVLIKKMAMDFEKLLSNLDNMSSQAENRGKREFHDMDMVFLSGIHGSYEMRCFADNSGEMAEPIRLHTINTPSGKVTVVCSGDDCEICKRAKKLEDLGYNLAWRFKHYTLYKVFVKFGSLEGEVRNQLKENSVYIAYVNRKYFQALANAISSMAKYSRDDIAKMLQISEDSGGFIVKVEGSGRDTNYSFNFIPQLKISGNDPKELFGEDLHDFSLSTQGYFRNNYVNQDKVNQAISYLDQLILDTVDKGATAIASMTDKGIAAPAPEAGFASASTPELPTAPASESITGIPAPDRAPAPDASLPPCYGEFNTENEKCLGDCQHKKSCIDITFKNK